MNLRRSSDQKMIPFSPGRFFSDRPYVRWVRALVFLMPGPVHQIQLPHLLDRRPLVGWTDNLTTNIIYDKELTYAYPHACQYDT